MIPAGAGVHFEAPGLELGLRGQPPYPPPPHPEPRSPSLSSPGISRRLIIFLFQANRLLNASKIDGAGMPQQNAGAALQVRDLSKIAVT